MWLLTISVIALSVYAYINYSGYRPGFEHSNICTHSPYPGQNNNVKVTEEIVTDNSDADETEEEETDASKEKDIEDKDTAEQEDKDKDKDDDKEENKDDEEVSGRAYWGRRTKIRKFKDEEDEVEEFLNIKNEEYANISIEVSHASWEIDSELKSLTSESIAKKIAICEKEAKFKKQTLEKIKKKFSSKPFKDEDINRQILKFSIIGTAALPSQQLEKLQKNSFKMQKYQTSTKLCDFKNPKICNYTISKVSEIMLNSNNTEELKHYWIQETKISGSKMKSLFFSNVKLLNEAARLNNFSHYGEFMLHSYESPDIAQQFEKLWNDIKPIYLELHAYVRYKIRKFYGSKVISSNGPIPVHLLGDIWSQNWVNVAKRTLPGPTKNSDDVTKEMVKQGYTPIKIFKLAEEFFVSLNLSSLPDKFWKTSLFEEPSGRKNERRQSGNLGISHASAWDMGDGLDFRIKQRTSVNFNSFCTAHKQMGYIQYFLQYKHQPFIYRNEPCDGFFEAVGDVALLSASSRTHLNKIGLLKGKVDEHNSNMNHLYSLLMDKLIILSFAYTFHLFRWSVFKGDITEENSNCEWWKLLETNHGIEPSVDRNKNNFDVGVNFHVYNNIHTIRFFVSSIVQFQFHKALCDKAGLYHPKDPKKELYKCDIFQKKEAGFLLQKMCRLGSSKPWPEVMEAITGQTKMDASALLEFFKPIIDFVKAKNKKKGLTIGWQKSKKSFGCSS